MFLSHLLILSLSLILTQCHEDLAYTCNQDSRYCGGSGSSEDDDISNRFIVVTRLGKQMFIPRFRVNSVADLVVAAQEAFKDESIARIVSYYGEPLIDRDGEDFNEMLAKLWYNGQVIALDDKELFMFPANRVGEVVHVKLPDREIAVRTLSIRPRVFELLDFLSEEECDHMIKRVSSIKMFESSVGDSTATSYKSDVRTSHQSWIGHSQHNDDEVFLRVRWRAVNFSRLEMPCAEDTQVVHYKPDWSMKASTRNNPYYKAGGNRMVTFLYYLNDVASGGHTVFPYANSTLTPENAPISYTKEVGGFDMCDVNSPGLRLSPKKGTAVLFYNLLEGKTFEGDGDLTNLHLGCDPTGDSEKWLANQWIRNKRVLVKHADGKSRWHLYDDKW